MPQDFNQSADVFALRFATANLAPVFSGQIIFVPNAGQLPTLTWPVVVGNSYRVEYKDKLNDPVWLPVNGTVTVVGDRGYVTDLAARPTHRFYRIRAF